MLEEIIRFAHLKTGETKGAGLTDFNLSVFAGEIVYITGIHGSGKHAVKRLLCGMEKKTGGRLYIDEGQVEYVDKMQYIAKGIYVLDGIEGLNGNLSLSENFFTLRPHRAGSFFYRAKYASRETGEILKEYHINCDPGARLSALTQLEQYLLCIAKAVSFGARLLVLDCLGLSLSVRDFERLSGMLRELQEKGVSVLVIDSIINPLLDIAGRAVILYGGRDIKTLYREEISPEKVESYLNHISIERKGIKDAELLGIFDPYRDTRTGFGQYVKELFQTQELAGFLRGAEFEGAPWKEGEVACIPENGGDLLLQNLSLGDNLMMPSYKRLSGPAGHIPPGVERYTALQFLEETGIGVQNVKDMGRAERKLVCIQRWILAKPPVILMENPDFGLDPSDRARVIGALRRAALGGIRVCITSHNPWVLQDSCSGILKIDKGNQVRIYTPDEFWLNVSTFS